VARRGEYFGATRFAIQHRGDPDLTSESASAGIAQNSNSPQDLKSINRATTSGMLNRLAFASQTQKRHNGRSERLNAISSRQGKSDSSFLKLRCADGSPISATMIEVKQLTKSYEELDAIKDVTFTIPSGQICGYLGPNGAGKSTTVRILTGVMPATSGTAVVAGFNVADDPLEVKKRIGYVPETGAIFQTLSVTEYLTLVGSLHHLAADLIAERTNMMLELFDIPASANQRIDTLSKGMRQKVVLSAAMIHDPDVLLFDEPLSGLDVNAAQVVKEILHGLAERGKTILYCSHILDVVERLCERVIILNQGQIVADGSPDELKEMAHRSTLEHVFRQLTSRQDQEGVANQFVDAISNKAPSKTTENSDTENSDTENSDTENSDTENSDTENSDTEK
jgi:ABC-2 type transport system ATP-binding protein